MLMGGCDTMQIDGIARIVRSTSVDDGWVKLEKVEEGEGSRKVGGACGRSRNVTEETEGCLKKLNRGGRSQEG
jgi:hypothetical protein